MYQFLLAIGIALSLPLSAWAFPIDVELQPGAAQVSVRTTDLSNLAALQLRNDGGGALYCQVAFVNGPERPVPRRVRLLPGEEVVVSQFFRRAINRVRVNIDCTAEGTESPA